MGLLLGAVRLMLPILLTVEEAKKGDPMAEQMLLEVVAGKDVGMQIAVSATGAILGRGSDCGIRLGEPTLSLKHCSFVLENEKWVVRDLSSRYGVIVNGCKTEGCCLKQGDDLKLGNLQLKVVSAPASKGEPTADTIRFQCQCGKTYVVKATFAGKAAPCKHCGVKMVIPAATLPEVAPTPVPSLRRQIALDFKRIAVCAMALLVSVFCMDFLLNLTVGVWVSWIVQMGIGFNVVRLTFMGGIVAAAFAVFAKTQNQRTWVHASVVAVTYGVLSFLLNVLLMGQTSPRGWFVWIPILLLGAAVGTLAGTHFKNVGFPAFSWAGWVSKLLQVNVSPSHSRRVARIAFLAVAAVALVAAIVVYMSMTPEKMKERANRESLKRTIEELKKASAEREKKDLDSLTALAEHCGRIDAATRHYAPCPSKYPEHNPGLSPDEYEKLFIDAYRKGYYGK